MSTTSPGVGRGLGTIADIANYATSNPTRFNRRTIQRPSRCRCHQQGSHRFPPIYWVPQSRQLPTAIAPTICSITNKSTNAVSLIWNRTISSIISQRSSGERSRVALERDHLKSAISGRDFPRTSSIRTGSITVNPWGPNVGSILNQWTYSYKDVATKIFGRHTVKFGGDATRLFYLNDCVACGVPSYSFFNMWDFLNDAPNEEGWYNRFNPNTGYHNARQDDRENILGFFVQDDFKVPIPNPEPRPALVLLRSALLQTKQHVCGHPGAGANS